MTENRLTEAHPWIVDQAAMYLAYHRDHRNVATHVVGVPMIVFAIMLLLHRLHLGFLAPGFLDNLTVGWLAVLGFCVFYVRMQSLAGGILALIFLAASAIAAPMALWPAGAFWTAFLVFFVGGWIIQLVGHSVFEGRRPALTDNLLQIFVAPLFLVFEALFRMGHLDDLRRRIETASHAYDPAPRGEAG